MKSYQPEISHREDLEMRFTTGCFEIHYADCPQLSLDLIVWSYLW